VSRGREMASARREVMMRIDALDSFACNSLTCIVSLSWVARYMEIGRSSPIIYNSHLPITGLPSFESMAGPPGPVAFTLLGLDLCADVLQTAPHGVGNLVTKRTIGLWRLSHRSLMRERSHAVKLRIRSSIGAHLGSDRNA
jgi:hypothetical protein